MGNQNAIEIRGLSKEFPRFQLGPLDRTSVLFPVGLGLIA